MRRHDGGEWVGLGKDRGRRGHKHARVVVVIMEGRGGRRDQRGLHRVLRLIVCV